MREILKINFQFVFRIILLTGILYAANASDGGHIGFIGEDQEFRCEGIEVRWILPNRTQVTANNSKFQIETIPERESKLIIKNINPRDIGPIRCVSNKVDKTFDLQVYCNDNLYNFKRNPITRK